MVEQVVKKRGFKATIPFWLMLAIFAIPYFAASYLYESGSFSSVGQASNYGDLISPVRKIERVELERSNGEFFDTTKLLDQWTLVAVGGDECGVCLDNLYKLRQIRLAVGKERKRVGRLYLVTGNEQEQISAYMDDFRGMDVVLANGAAVEALKLEPWSWEGSLAGGIFIIDPLGNLMMAYRPGFETKEILKDLQRLLKLSKIG